ncbi:HlyD family efflux transporter periplasmic adaptor subunit [Buttiauxella brennerae]|uniref:HlyD family efflux transporter periplasmic adaptor subunit n=1 Tax=Buttiauxella brennerae TaxID=82988 RepID=UPI00286EB4B3|nr:HlyD family efflux transporter periplasmic adaptor subunit [Buttiauxella brennerae]
MSLKLRFAASCELMKRYRSHFSWFWKQRHAFTPPPLKADEAEFLPAALALQLAPVSPTARWTARLLMVLIAFLVLWSFFGKVDIIVSASGKIIPSAHTKTIASVETARVERIDVKDGQTVRAGELLLVLDTQIIDHEKMRAKVDQDAATLQVARSRALLDSMTANKFTVLSDIQNIPPEMVSDARQHLTSQWQSVESRLHDLDGEITRYSMQLPIVRERAQSYKDLAQNHDVSVTSWQEKEQDKIELEGKLADARHQRESFIAETRKKTEDELNEGLRQQAESHQDVQRASAHKTQLQLTAPVDGTVQQLAVHTVGGVVTAAQPLMVIVPQQNQVEIEAIVENKDIGFIHKGQHAAVKIEAFDYTRYGMMQGEVTYVSRDAMNAGASGAGESAPANHGEDAQKAQNSQYAIHIKLANKTMVIDGEPSALKPGMSASIEIKTGSRRVIEYFLSPLIQHSHESLNER